MRFSHEPTRPPPHGRIGPSGEGTSHEDDAVAQATVMVWGIGHGRRGGVARGAGECVSS